MTWSAVRRGPVVDQTDQGVRGLVRRRAVGTGVVCVVLLVAVYVGAVWTRAGQRFEDAVLRGAELVAAHGGGGVAGPLLNRLSENALAEITVFSTAGAVLVVAAIGLLRRRGDLALAGAGVIVASVVTSVVLRTAVLSRPILLHAGERREDQSFPSGHVTVAMAVMCGLLMVVPYRARGAVVFVSCLFATGVGAATVTASWHRPSDTVGGDLIVLAYSCAAVALLAWRGSVCQARSPAPIGRALLGTLGAGVIVGAAVLNDLTAFPAQVTHGVADHSAFAAGRAIALGAGGTVAVVMLALLRGADLSPPARPDSDPQRKIRRLSKYRQIDADP